MGTLAKLPSISVRAVAMRSLATLVRETYPELTDAGVLRRAMRAGVDAFVDTVTRELLGTARDQALVALAKAPRWLRASVLMESADGPCVALLSDGEWVAARPPRGSRAAQVTVVVDGRTVGTVPHAQLCAAFA